MHCLPFSGGLLCLLVSSFSAFCQPSSPPSPTNATPPVEGKRYVGFRVGYSHYAMRGSEADFRATPYRIGAIEYRDANQPVHWVTAGVVLRQRLYKPLSFETGLTYVRQGGKVDDSAGGGLVLVDSDYTYDNVQVPLLLTLQAYRVGPVSLHVEGGLAVNFVARGVAIDEPNYHPSNTFSNPVFIPATAYGAQLAWHHQQAIYLLSLRYTTDLTDFYQRHYVGTHYLLRSAGFSVTTGMLFGQP